MVLNAMEENRAGRFRKVGKGGFYSVWPEMVSWKRYEQRPEKEKEGAI